MAEYSGFFDAHLLNGEYDRVYLAEHFARYFASFIGNGVFGGKSSELMVRQKDSADMSVRVMAGQGFINGYFYENDDELSLAIDNADGVLSRIDLIVLRWDKNERSIRVAVEKGAFASFPSAPLLKRNDDFYELELAKIYVKAGATRITQADITDMRLDPSVCGFVVSVVDNFDTAEFNAQLNMWIEQFRADSIEEVNRLVDDIREILESGDLTPIFSDIEKLKNMAIESEEYPGCFYRDADGEAEWLNPPLEPGVEFRTTERFEERPVYKMLVHVPSLPNTSLMIVTPNFMMSKLMSIDGVLFDSATSYNEVYPFPVFMSSSVAPDAMIINAMPGLAWTNIAILTTRDLTRYKADIVVKYVK